MPDIGVEPRSLRAAARGSEDVAAELRVVDPRVADPIAEAMPSSGAAKYATRVSHYWEERLKRSVSSLDQRAQNLIAAADRYDGGEQKGVADFTGLAPGAEREQ